MTTDSARKDGSKPQGHFHSHADERSVREIEQAILRQCNINPVAFAVAGVDDQGHSFTLTSDKLHRFTSQIIAAVNSSLAPSSAPVPVPAIYADENRSSDYTRRSSNHSNNNVNIKPKALAPGKRRRSPSRNQAIYDNIDDDDNEHWPANLEPTGTQSVSFQIKDFRQVVSQLGLRIDQMQQLALKAVEKLWIKTIEPKKQSRFPYVNSDDSKKRDDKTSKKRIKPRDGPDTPSWWPTERQEWWSWLPHPACKTLQKVRHKEPDHLRKEERLVLGVQILLVLAERPGGIDLLENSTKDCILSFDPDGAGSLERKRLREIFLADCYELARYWSDYLDGGLDGEDQYTMKVYPKQALGPAKKAKSTTTDSRKRARKNSSPKSQTGQTSRAHRSHEDELVRETKQLDLQNQAWDAATQQDSDSPFVPNPDGDGYRFTSANKQASNSVSSQQAAALHPIYEEPLQSRYPYESKPAMNFADQSGYAMNRDQGYMSQYSPYPSDWRSLPPQSSSSYSSPTSLAPNSTVSYPSSNTSFPGNMNYSFNQQISSGHVYNSPIPQQIGLAIPVAEPQMQQMAQAPLPMMHGMRGQGGYEESQYANQQFRTGSLGHPNLSYGMSGSQFG
ncbi:hypothetical protein IWX49DRAFT_569075 [Phyllosticta citricarpa]|uniref:Subtelomeric hrmA-associated cluster protein AFUB-079030/YDR124W-like helical bundle domain-containing protein n=2 Tax=Phyllosticta TaxID=121621 RepID=A0ABR1LDH6_9PEZI